MDEQEAADQAHGTLRSHSRGELRYDELFDRLGYVIGPTGALVWPASHAMLDARETVLFVPENAHGAMEILVTLVPLDPDGPQGALADRWRIYHGDPHEAGWASAEIDTARFEGMVIDGVELVRPSPLAPAESRLCRTFNQNHRGELRAFCAHFAGADVEAPLLVGIDPLGFDVRRRFDVVRVPAPAPMTSPEAVGETFARMLQEAAAADA